MIKSATPGVFFLLLVLILTCCRLCVTEQNDTTDADLCLNLNIAMVQNSSTGMQILLTTAGTDPTTDHDLVAEIPNRTLPPECGTNNHWCAVHPFENGEITYYIIPSIGGFVTFSHNASYVTGHTDEDLESWISFTNVVERCNPTTAFYAGPEGGFRLYVVCLNLTSQPQGSLYILEYSLSLSVGGVEWKKMASRSEPIFNTSTVSEVIYVRGQERCLYRNNIYFIDDSYVLQFPADIRALDPQFQSSGDLLETCTSHQRVEYYRDDTLIIRCSNGQTVLHDSCAGVHDYQSPDRVPYPCMNWETVIYRNRSQLTLEHGNGEGTPPKIQQLPFSDLSYGKCVNQGDHPTFVASSADDGAVVIAPLDGNDVTKLTTGSCFDKAVCHRPVFSEDGRVFGVYDASTGAFKIFNFTLECHSEWQPMQISTPFVPDLVSISQGKGQYSCGCSTIMDHTVSNLKKDDTVETRAGTRLVHFLPVVVGVVVLALIASLAGAIALVFRHRNRIRAESPETTPLQAGSNQVTSDVCTGTSFPHTVDRYHQESVCNQHSQRTSDNDLKADMEAKVVVIVNQ